MHVLVYLLWVLSFAHSIVINHDPLSLQERKDLNLTLGVDRIEGRLGPSVSVVGNRIALNSITGSSDMRIDHGVSTPRISFHGGAKHSILDTYIEYAGQVRIKTGISGPGAINFTGVRIGKMVTLQIDEWFHPCESRFIETSQIEVPFLFDASSHYHHIFGISRGSTTDAFLVMSNGRFLLQFKLYADAFGSISGTCGMRATSFSYNVCCIVSD